MIRKSIFIILATLIPLGALAFFIHAASAATALIGCSPTSLTVKTGQTFYITVAVTNTLDLYAWQMDATYYPVYLEYVAIFSGDHLRIDGASDYLVKPGIISGSTSSEMRLAADTRLSKDTGVDGSGRIAFVMFRAIKQKLDGSNVTLNEIKLVDRNALDIAKSLVNSGTCKVYISDSAPPLVQPPVGVLMYLPLVER